MPPPLLSILVPILLLFIPLGLLTASLALLIHALVSFHKTEGVISHLASTFPSTGPLKISIDVNAGDIEHTGIALGVGCAIGMVGVLGLMGWIILQHQRARAHEPVHMRAGSAGEKEKQGYEEKSKESSNLGGQTRLLLALPLLISAALIFSTVIPFTYFFATRQAKVVARLGQTVISDEAVKQVERGLGLTGVYREVGYLKPAVILPWLALLTTVLTLLALLISPRSLHLLPTTAASTTSGNPRTATRTRTSTKGIRPKPSILCPEMSADRKVTPGNSSFGNLNPGSGMGATPVQSEAGSGLPAPHTPPTAGATGGAINGAGDLKAVALRAENSSSGSETATATEPEAKATAAATPPASTQAHAGPLSAPSTDSIPVEGEPRSPRGPGAGAGRAIGRGVGKGVRVKRAGSKPPLEGGGVKSGEGEVV